MTTERTERHVHVGGKDAKITYMKQPSENVDNDIEAGREPRIDSTAEIGRFVHLGKDTHIGQGVRIGNAVTVESRVTIKPNSLIEDGATIEADVTIGRDCHIGKNARICTDVPDYAEIHPDTWFVPDDVLVVTPASRWLHHQIERRKKHLAR